MTGGMADALTLTLYGNHVFSSPYVFSVFVALTEKGLPFDLELLDLDAGDHRRGGYPERSFTGRVPALRHGDVWIAESSAIDEYLEETFPPPRWPRLYPEGAALRAKARMVQAFVRSDLGALRAERPTSTFFQGEAARPLSPDGKAAAERLCEVAGRFLPEGASHVAGAFTIADPDLALMLQRLVANGDPCPPRLAAYARAVFQRPSVRAWLARTRWRDPPGAAL
jgi:glutathione S-transferase